MDAATAAAAASATRPVDRPCSTPLVVYDGGDILPCQLTSVIEPPVRFLGSGMQGAAFQCVASAMTLSIYMEKLAHVGRPVTDRVQFLRSAINKPIVAKLTTVTDENFIFVQAELAIAELILRSNIPTVNLVQPLFWTRLAQQANFDWITKSELDTAIKARLVTILSQQNSNLAVIVSEFADSGTLNAHIDSIRLRARPGPDYWRAFMQCVLVQMFAGLATMRSVIPDFRHNDLHFGNILCTAAHAPLRYLAYRIETQDDATIVIADLSAVGGMLLKISDFGYSDGTYVSTRWPSLSSLHLREHVNLTEDLPADHVRLAESLVYRIINHDPVLIANMTTLPDLAFIDDLAAIPEHKVPFRRADFYHRLLAVYQQFPAIRIPLSTWTTNHVALGYTDQNTVMVPIPKPASISVEPLDAERRTVQ